MNPKDAIGATKLPLHLWPASASAMGCLGLFNGSLKYGRSNFRATPVLASVYAAALKRHAEAWFEGEDIDPDEKIPHLAGALANLAIVVDALAAGTLVDDRQFPGGYRKFVDSLMPYVGVLKALHAGKTPKHWTIQDTTPSSPTEKTVRVVVGVAARKGKILLQQRALKDDDFAGCWECPGGGVHEGEHDALALRREWREELGVRTGVTGPVLWSGSVAGYGGKKFVFNFYPVTKLHGEPRVLDGQGGLRWFSLKAAAKLRMTPANLLAWPVITEYMRDSWKR